MTRITVHKVKRELDQLMKTSATSFGNLKTAKLIIIAQDPGEHERKFKCPLVGPAGKNLLLMICIATGKAPDLDMFIEKPDIWKHYLPGKTAIRNMWSDKNDNKPAEWRRGKDIEKLRQAILDGRHILVLGKGTSVEFNRVFAEELKSNENVQYWAHPSPLQADSFWVQDMGNLKLKNVLSFIKGALDY